MRLRHVLAGILLTTAMAAAHPEYRFADDFTAQELLTQPGRARQFMELYARHEAPFFRAARHPQTALSYDGLNLIKETGQVSKVRDYSAPSKECLDLALLIKGLEGHPLAAQLISPEEPGRAPEVSYQLLERKLKGYQTWKQKYPGFRGYMPWFNTDTLEPIAYVQGAIPGLDNGEWVWAMLVVERELRLRGHQDLARGYAEYLATMQKWAGPIFWDPKQRVQRGDVHVVDPKDPNSKFEMRSQTFMRGEHGVHEGIMIMLFVTLLGEGLPPGASQDIWNSTRMVRLESPYGTTWQGWYASSHESWQYLFLPMRDVAEFRQLFRIREVIRSRNAVAHHYPGFATSALAPGDDPGQYLDGAGIEGITSQKLKNQHIYTLYGAFPSLLLYADSEEPNLALTWLLNMLKGPKMQGPLGAGEAGSNDGTKVTLVKTCDGTYPNLLAMMGGLEKETAEMMKERGIYDKFLDILRGEYQEAFGKEPLKEPCKFVPPQQTIPRGQLPDYQE